MEGKIAKLQSLIGRDLSGEMWKVDEFIAVYATDHDGRPQSKPPKGLYRDKSVVNAIRQQETYICLIPVLVLSNGIQAFVLNPEPIDVCNDEAKKLELREKALAKLSPEERAILGFKP